jgi:hypothetical protein
MLELEDLEENGKEMGEGREANMGITHHLIMLISKFLAHELAHPVLTSTSVLGLQTGDYERHVVWC